MDQYQAYDYFGMDPVIYVAPNFICNSRDLEKWDVKNVDLGRDKDGNHSWQKIITTPEGTLTERWESNQYTSWIMKKMIPVAMNNL